MTKDQEIGRLAHFRFCVFHETWAEAQRNAARELQTSTLADLRRKYGIVN